MPGNMEKEAITPLMLRIKLHITHIKKLIRTNND